MKKIIGIALLACLACLACLAWSAESQAQSLDRQFPLNVSYCESTQNGLPSAATVQISQLSRSGTARLSAALVIRDQSNRIIVSGMLPQKWQGMCGFGVDGSLDRLWILTSEQAKAQADKAKAAKAAS